MEALPQTCPNHQDSFELARIEDVAAETVYVDEDFDFTAGDLLVRMYPKLIEPNAEVQGTDDDSLATVGWTNSTAAILKANLEKEIAAAGALHPDAVQKSSLANSVYVNSATGVGDTDIAGGTTVSSVNTTLKQITIVTTLPHTHASLVGKILDLSPFDSSIKKGYLKIASAVGAGGGRAGQSNDEGSVLTLEWTSLSEAELAQRQSNIFDPFSSGVFATGQNFAITNSIRPGGTSIGIYDQLEVTEVAAVPYHLKYTGYLRSVHSVSGTTFFISNEVIGIAYIAEGFSFMSYTSVA